jgi:enoyl-CoA hydratase/carnithine racemase
LSCDILIASEDAKFGLPEVTLGLLPGAGGTQRLIRQVGKSKAMEMILTGDMISAKEALDYKVVSQVVKGEDLAAAALKIAKNIGRLSKIATGAAKMTVSRAYEVGLAEGTRYEAAFFNTLTGTKDSKIGIDAFLTKQKPKFVHD